MTFFCQFRLWSGKSLFRILLLLFCGCYHAVHVWLESQNIFYIGNYTNNNKFLLSFSLLSIFFCCFSIGFRIAYRIPFRNMIFNFISNLFKFLFDNGKVCSLLFIVFYELLVLCCWCVINHQISSNRTQMIRFKL